MTLSPVKYPWEPAAFRPSSKAISPWLKLYMENVKAENIGVVVLLPIYHELYTSS